MNETPEFTCRENDKPQHLERSG